MKAENPTDREMCECPRCGKSHWKLGNSPIGAKLARELRFWGDNGETDSQATMLKAAAILDPWTQDRQEIERLQATYNDLLALQDQTDLVPLATALDAVGSALAALSRS